MSIKKLLFITIIILLLSISAVSADNSTDNNGDALELSDDFTFQDMNSEKGEINEDNLLKDFDKKDVNFTMSVDDVFVADDVVVYFNISSDIENYDEAQGEAEIWEYENDTSLKSYPAYDSGFYLKDGIIILPADAEIFNYPLNAGRYLFTLDFCGDEFYNPKSINRTFNVYPADYNMTGNRTVINVEDFNSFSSNKRLYFNLTDINNNPLKNRTVSIKINGVTYNRTTGDNGSSSIAINLPSGDYSTVLSFEGDEEYLPTKVIAFLWIPSTIECDDAMVKYFRDSQAFWAKFYDYGGNSLKGGKASFNINGVFYTRDIDENGYSKLNINLEQGKYILTATNPITGDMKSCLITVLPTITDNHDLIKYYRNASQYTARLQGEEFTNQKVTFNINGVFYERFSDEKGNVKLNINLEPGKYIITAEFNDCRVSNNITVLPTIVTEDLFMKYKDGSQFNATILNGQGETLANQKVTFNINGVFYERTTDDAGVAHLNINLMDGKYIITTSCNGLDVSNHIMISSFEEDLFCSVQRKIDAAGEGETILLDNDVMKGIFYYDGDSVIENEIIINKAVIIDGQGHTISAEGKGRIFNITSDNVTLKNITFIRGSVVYDNGGAVYNTGDNIIISDCQFRENQVYYYGTTIAEGRGGAICSYGNLTVTKCVFEDNWVSGVDYAAGRGGAIYSNAAVNISFSTFSKNIVFDRGSGGAVYSNAAADIFYSTFKENSANNGGAVYSNDTLTVHASDFMDNSADAICAYAFKADIGDDCNFINNENTLLKFNQEMD